MRGKYECMCVCVSVYVYMYVLYVSSLPTEHRCHTGILSNGDQLTHKYLVILAGTTSYKLNSRNVMKWFCILTMCSYLLQILFLYDRCTYYAYWIPTISSKPSRPLSLCAYILQPGICADAANISSGADSVWNWNRWEFFFDFSFTLICMYVCIYVFGSYRKAFIVYPTSYICTYIHT